MEKNTKIELAKAIIEKLIGREIANGTNLDDSGVEELLKLRKEVYHFNEEIIDEILQNYREAILGGENNG